MVKHWENDDFVGERLCLDFINTANHWREPERFTDKLESYDDLYAWLAHARTLDRDEIRWTVGFKSADEEIQRRVMSDARKLRATLYEVFSAIIEGGSPEPLALSQLYEAVGSSVLFVKPVNGNPERTWNKDTIEILKPSGLLYPIAFSATRLLVEDCLCYIKQCGGDGCDWIFLDCSKSHRRRWCDMKTCGNRNKARKHYKKKCEAGVC